MMMMYYYIDNNIHIIRVMMAVMAYYSIIIGNAWYEADVMKWWRNDDSDY